MKIAQESTLPKAPTQCFCACWLHVKQTYLYDLEIELNNIAPVVLHCLWLSQPPIQICQQRVVDVVHKQPHPTIGVERRCA
jgi:hypothetical protein